MLDYHFFIHSLARFFVVTHWWFFWMQPATAATSKNTCDRNTFCRKNVIIKMDFAVRDTKSLFGTHCFCVHILTRSCNECRLMIVIYKVRKFNIDQSQFSSHIYKTSQWRMWHTFRFSPASWGLFLTMHLVRLTWQSIHFLRSLPSTFLLFYRTEYSVECIRFTSLLVLVENVRGFKFVHIYRLSAAICKS